MCGVTCNQKCMHSPNGDFVAILVSGVSSLWCINTQMNTLYILVYKIPYLYFCKDNIYQIFCSSINIYHHCTKHCTFRVSSHSNIFHVYVSRSIMSDSLQPHGLQPTRLLLSVKFFWQEYWSSHSLMQGIFPTQRSNLGLLHSSRILYCLRHLGSFFMNTV